jgi:peptidoglycan hydrolase-like protein with peptidoglycan-binding domain
MTFLKHFAAALGRLAVFLGAVAFSVAALGYSLGAFAADSAAVTTVKLVQEQLHHHGFYSGRIDGELSGDTQAALAQFQLSRNIPASGALDETTLMALGVQREREQETQMAASEPSAAAGGSAAPEKKD